MSSFEEEIIKDGRGYYIPKALREYIIDLKNKFCLDKQKVKEAILNEMGISFNAYKRLFKKLGLDEVTGK